MFNLRMFKLCASFNRCIEDVHQEDNIFIDCRFIAPGSLTDIGELFDAMQPDNMAIVQYILEVAWDITSLYGHSGMRRMRDGTFTIGEVKLFCGRTIADLALDIEDRCGRRNLLFLMVITQDIIYLFSP